MVRTVCVLTQSPDNYSVVELVEAIKRAGAEPLVVTYNMFTAELGVFHRVKNSVHSLVESVDVLLVRSPGKASTEQLFFRMDVLRSLERLGVRVINRPQAIEVTSDKYATSALLQENGIPVPRTVVTEGVREALRGFRELGGDVLVKPIFGSQGMGICRVSDEDAAWRVFFALESIGSIILLQEFVQHEEMDIRALVIGDEVVGTMRRINPSSWRKNIATGAEPSSVKLSREDEVLAVKSAKIVGCEVAGVDLIKRSDGKSLVIEVNGSPSWKGLQKVTKINIADQIVKYALNTL